MASDAFPPPAGQVVSHLYEAKRGLRAQILTDRDAMPADLRATMSAAIVSSITRLPSFAEARVVVLTLSFRSEWDTGPLVAAALTLHKTVAVPRVAIATRMLELHAIRSLGSDVVPGFHGISEPLPTLPRVDPALIDWILVPGVAFDDTGLRLGYGGGYYDRLLPLVPPTAQRVAGAFDLQIVEHVPAAEYDLRVNTIVTPSRTINAA